jgi:hypothetical protein
MMGLDADWLNQIQCRGFARIFTDFKIGDEGAVMGYRYSFFIASIN